METAGGIDDLIFFLLYWWYLKIVCLNRTDNTQNL